MCSLSNSISRIETKSLITVVKYHQGIYSIKDWFKETILLINVLVTLQYLNKSNGAVRAVNTEEEREIGGYLLK